MLTKLLNILKLYGHLPLIGVICVVTIIGSMLEGFNIGMLVPLLESLQSDSLEEGHWVTSRFSSLFASVGIPFHLGSIMVVLGVLVLFQSGLKYLRMILVAKLTNGFVAWMRVRTMASLLNADENYFHEERMGVLTNTLTTQSIQAGTTIFAIAEILSLMAVIISYLTAAFLVSPGMTIIAISIMFVITFAMQFLINKAKPMGEALVDQNNRLHTQATENLSGIRIIKCFLLQELKLESFAQVASGISNTTYRIERNRSLMTVLQEAALFGLVAALVYLGVRVFSADLAITVALLFILYRIAPRVSTLNNLRQSLNVTIPSLMAVFDTINQSSNTRIVAGEKPFSKLSKSIAIEKVTFSYSDHFDVLSNVSVNLEKNQITAFVGASGAGKSTLMDLLLRFHDPDRGRILVDDRDLKDIDLKSWWGSIGVVSQDVFLFNDTLKNNILVGRPDATMDEVVNSAKRAYVHDFAMQLPDGYDTELGERGSNLSGGQRQRIALARAIIKSPSILILDEATSSLDSESERIIQDYVQLIKGKVTIIVVAHRMGTIRVADKIVVLDNGEIVEEGDWDTLLAKPGIFANYHRLQSGMTGPV